MTDKLLPAAGGIAFSPDLSTAFVGGKWVKVKNYTCDYQSPHERALRERRKLRRLCRRWNNG